MNSTDFRPTDRALDYLLSPDGQDLLARLVAEEIAPADILSHTTRLRATHSPEIVSAALDLALLRQRARAKFSRADQMYLTREALEQASAEIVSRHGAARYAECGQVVDLCCGIGGDALALAAHADVLAVDLDPLRLRMAAANADVYGVGERLQTRCDDATTYALAPGAYVWADPGRRVNGRRMYSVFAYQPPLDALLDSLSAAPGAGCKLAPGVRYEELDRLLGDTAHEVEILSVRGEAREAVLWLGELCTARRRATLLPGGHSLTGIDQRGTVPVQPVGPFLYEPDPAVIRAHLVERLALEIGASKIDDQIAYLTAGKWIDSPFVTGYRVEQVMPFGLKRINRALRERDVGELVIKKRGLGIDPEQFRRRLKVGHGQTRTVLVLTRVQDRPTALICLPAEPISGTLQTGTG